ncbi:GNAT family N-acetyltransferase [Lactococcus nasutitermitis]|uniref:GNAT family N-acetyltransferase n=1 Tax=Lactococcus nasutitermitis TaxID=1652957 RepID=A0ABV9JF83_9LACT|nr:GNAT family N-acetyltransferase [Lactococcus nasutitermitis]
MIHYTLDPVKKSEKEILRNLLEKYLYEFSQYCDDEVNELGLYGYDYLDCYWTEKNRFPFFIRVDGNLAGFALVNDYPEIKAETDFTMAEFFVIYKYRHTGIAQAVARDLFEKFQGKWQLMYNPKNVISQKFWTKIVTKIDEKYQCVTNSPQAIYHSDIQGHVLIFKS